MAASLLVPTAVTVPAAGAQPAGGCGGFVFHDINVDGTWNTSAAPQSDAEPPEPGAIVDIVDADGLQVRVTTGDDGSWRAPSDVVFPLRLDFEPPAGFVIGPAGDDAGFATQFDVSSEDCTATDAAGAHPTGTVGVHAPGQFCAENTQIITSCFVVGNVEGHDAMASIISLPSSATDNGATDGSSAADWLSEPYEILATVGQTGAADGLAVGPDGTVYAAGFVKRNTRLVSSLNPSGNPTVIYRVAPQGEPAVFVTVDPTARDPHGGVEDPAGYATDQSAIGAVFTEGLGDLQLSSDGSTLYAVDLGNRRLVAIDVETAEVRGRIDLDGEALGIDGCLVSSDRPFGDLRPFGLGLDTDGSLLIGVVCSAESTVSDGDFPVDRESPGDPAGDARSLVGYVIDYDGSGFTPRLVWNLAGDRGRMQTNGRVSHDAAWHPWVNVYPFDEEPDAVAYPQPAITDITLDARGDLIVAVGDRWGNQTAPLTEMASWDGTTRSLGEPLVAGDLMWACAADDGWVIEGSPGCPGGLGSAEHFRDDRYGIHDETALGSVAAIPGTDQIIAGHMDPIGGDETWRSGGFKWHDVETGTAIRGVRIYDGRNASPDATFEKATGVGGIAIDCGEPPIQLAGTVWTDVFDLGNRQVPEQGIAGVAIELVDSTGAIVGRTATANDGRYLFDTNNVDVRLVAGEHYRLVMPIENWADGAPFGRGGLATGRTLVGESGVGFDNKAVIAGGDGPWANVPSIDVVAGDDPATDAVEGFANHRLGFAMTDQYDLALAATVGAVDLAAGLATFEITVRNQGSLASDAFVIAAELPAGTSLVRMSEDVGSTSTPTPGVVEWFVDSEHQLDPQQSVMVELVVRIDEPLIEYVATAWIAADSGDDDDSDPDPDLTSASGDPLIDMTVADLDRDAPPGVGVEDDHDIARLGVGEIGGLIWYDTNVSATVDRSEAPVPAGVAVELRDQDGELVAQTVTGADGRYVFSLLTPGEYRVGIADRYFTDSEATRVILVTRPLVDPVLTANEAPGDHRTRPVLVDGASRLGETIASPSGTFDGASDLLVDFGLVQPTPPNGVHIARRLLLVAVVAALCVVLYVVWRRRTP